MNGLFFDFLKYFFFQFLIFIEKESFKFEKIFNAKIFKKPYQNKFINKTIF